MDLHNAFKQRILFLNMDNYESLISRISSISGVSVEDIDRKIEAKRAKLSGLVSKEGAAQIVASELGINFDQERLKIAEIVHGMRRVNVIGKVLDVFPIRQYNKNGREGKVCNFLIADESSNARVVLWDNHHIGLFEDKKLKAEDVIEISNANVRNGEIHLTSFSDIKKSKEVLANVVIEKVFSGRKIKDIRQGERFKTRAVIVQIFDPKYFNVCEKCGKKAVEGVCSGEHGKVGVKKRALLSVVLDDGSDSIRGVLFSEQIKRLGLSEDDVFSLDKFQVKKNELLGEEKFFCGNVKLNTMFNTIEMNVEDVIDIDAQKLIQELERR